MKRRLARLGIITAATALVLAGSHSAWAQRAGTVEVFKTPTCGCCHLWVEHLKQNGFETRVTDMDDLSAVKKKHGVPAKATSCHTAVVSGYVVEGHVPAAEIKRLLKEKPAVAGLAVAGMPVGSPGMEVGHTVQPYNVLAFDKTGQLKVFASYPR